MTTKKAPYLEDPLVRIDPRALSAALRSKRLSVREAARCIGELPQTIQRVINAAAPRCRASRRAKLAGLLNVTEAFLSGESGNPRRREIGEFLVDIVPGSSTPRIYRAGPTAHPAPMVSLQADQLVVTLRRAMKRRRVLVTSVRDGDAESERRNRDRERAFLERSAELTADTSSLESEIRALLSLERWRARVFGEEHWNWYPSAEEEDRFASRFAEAITLVLAPALQRHAVGSNRDLEMIGQARRFAATLTGQPTARTPSKPRAVRKKR